MISKVDPILGMSLNDDAEEVSFDNGTNNPFMQYGGAEEEIKERKPSKRATGKASSSETRESRDSRGASSGNGNGAHQQASSSSSSRPRSAARRRDDAESSGSGMIGNEGVGRTIKSEASIDRDAYPTARGLIRK